MKKSMYAGIIFCTCLFLIIPMFPLATAQEITVQPKKTVRPTGSTIDAIGFIRGRYSNVEYHRYSYDFKVYCTVITCKSAFFFAIAIPLQFSTMGTYQNGEELWLEDGTYFGTIGLGRFHLIVKSYVAGP